MRRRLRNGTIIEVLPTGSRVTLPDGAVVLGEPHDSASYRLTAHEHGYGEDTLRMAQEHDPLHAALCDWLGLHDSSALRLAAGGEADPTVAAAEERAVLSLQHFCRLAGVQLFIDDKRVP